MKEGRKENKKYGDRIKKKDMERTKGMKKERKHEGSKIEKRKI